MRAAESSSAAPWLGTLRREHLCLTWTVAIAMRDMIEVRLPGRHGGNSRDRVAL
jgi:hypothetical protein